MLSWTWRAFFYLFVIAQVHWTISLRSRRILELLIELKANTMLFGELQNSHCKMV